MEEFIRIRNRTYNLFKPLKLLNALKVQNDYDKARTQYKKQVFGDKETIKNEYRIRYMKVEPYFMGFQPLDFEMNLQISESVWLAVRTLKQLLSNNNLPEPENVLLFKVNQARIDIALVYEHELQDFIKALNKFEELNVEWYGNSYMLNRKKLEALIHNYTLRAKPLLDAIKVLQDKEDEKKNKLNVVNYVKVMRNEKKEF